MSTKKSMGLLGPFDLAVGGTVMIFPLLYFFRELYAGRLTFPYEEAFNGALTYTCLFFFMGLLLVGMGLQLIIRDSR
jgi:hypothetical protein